VCETRGMCQGTAVSGSLGTKATHFSKKPTLTRPGHHPAYHSGPGAPNIPATAYVFRPNVRQGLRGPAERQETDVRTDGSASPTALSSPQATSQHRRGATTVCETPGMCEGTAVSGSLGTKATHFSKKPTLTTPRHHPACHSGPGAPSANATAYILTTKLRQGFQGVTEGRAKRPTVDQVPSSPARRLPPTPREEPTALRQRRGACEGIWVSSCAERKPTAL